MRKLGRLITAMVTPFDDKGQVNYNQAKKLALALINSGSDGLVISGTTGESPVLSKSEKLRLFSEIKEAIGNKGVVIANTGNYSTAESIELTREASKTGIDAVMAVVPYYNKPTQEGLFQHFSAIANSTDLPMIVYNVPGRTVTNINAETIIRLSRLKNIIGLKEASGNIAQVSAVIQETNSDFMVYSGNDADTLSIMAVGGYGVISVASHIVGIQIKNMVDYYLAGKVNEAASIYRQLMPIFDKLFIVSNPIPVKYALNKIGFNVGKPRLPLVEIDEKSAAIVDIVMKKCQIDLKW